MQNLKSDDRSLYEKVMAEMQTKLDELTGKSDEMVKKIDDEKKLRNLYFIVKGFFEKLGLR